MKAVLVIDMPSRCADCNCQFDYVCVLKDIDLESMNSIPDWCPLRHPLKEVSDDFYIYDRKYLFAHLDREVELLQSTKRFEEHMKAREE